MTLLTVVKDVCATVGVQVPTGVFAGINANRTMYEMLTLAIEVAQRLAYDTREWTMLKTTATFTGDGIATSFPLPANFRRMLLTANVWHSGNIHQPMTFVPDTDEWLQRRSGYTNYSAPWGEWTIYGGRMHIFPTLAALIPADPLATPPTLEVPAHTVRFTYLDRMCINLASGGTGDRFMSDDDSYRLDERLLKLAMIWQWKAQKGSPYAEDMGSFSDALALAMGSDSPAPIIIGRTNRRSWLREDQW